MYVSELVLHNFRSYKDLSISIVPGINLLVGYNGSGKTNLVESVYYLSTLCSHRVTQDKALIRQGQSEANLKVRAHRENRSVLLELDIIDGKANKARVNKNQVKTRELLGWLNSVIFSPEDIDIVRGDPAGRRNFLNIFMIQNRPRLLDTKNSYEKILRQRSAFLKSSTATYLKTGQYNEYFLDVLDEQLAKQAAKIIAARAYLISELRTYVKQSYLDVSALSNQNETQKNNARVDYLCSLEKAEGLENIENLKEEDFAARESQEKLLQDEQAVEERMLKVLKSVRKEELTRGVCLVGPHRDDLFLKLGNLPAKGFCSHGESWSYALALRLGQWKVLEKWEPILILDDVFAELDRKRRESLASLVKKAQQVLITVAVGEDLPENLEGNKYWVNFSDYQTGTEVNEQQTD